MTAGGDEQSERHVEQRYVQFLGRLLRSAGLGTVELTLKRRSELASVTKSAAELQEQL